MSEEQDSQSDPSAAAETARGYVCVWFSVEMLEMLQNTQMLDLHDDNGPGCIECPVCGASTAMQWRWGVRLDSTDDIKHHSFCPVSWARGYQLGSQSVLTDQLKRDTDQAPA